MDLFESFATATFNYNPDAETPLHSVTFYNLRTQQPVKIDVLPDTGASMTVLNDKYAKLLGVDENMAQPGAIEGVGDRTKQGFIATVPMRIANLAPVPVDVIFVPDAPTNILGRQRGFSHYNTRFTFNKIYYNEIAKTALVNKKAAALAMSYATFKWRR